MPFCTLFGLFYLKEKLKIVNPRCNLYPPKNGKNLWFDFDQILHDGYHVVTDDEKRFNCDVTVLVVMEMSYVTVKKWSIPCFKGQKCMYLLIFLNTNNTIA